MAIYGRPIVFGHLPSVLGIRNGAEAARLASNCGPDFGFRTQDEARTLVLLGDELEAA